MPRSTSRPRASKKAAPASRSTSALRRTLVALAAAGLAALQVTHCGGEPSPGRRRTQPPPAASAPRTAPPAAAQGMVQTHFAGCPQHFAVAPPQVPRAWPTLRELCFADFAVLHSGQTRTPVVVAERLNRRSLARAKQQKRTDRFYADARLPQAERAELADYKGSGYARGHMAPAGDMPSAEGMAQSFSLANMVPQDPRNNSGVWSK